MSDAGDKGQRQVFRSRSKTIVSIVFGLVGIIIGLGTVIEKHDRPASVFFGSVVFAVSAFLGGRGAWSGVFTNDEGIHVANIFRSVDLRWGEIDHFEIGRWKLFPYVCLVHTNSGIVVPAIGIEEKTQVPEGAAMEMVDELNAELLERSAAAHRGAGAEARA